MKMLKSRRSEIDSGIMEDRKVVVVKQGKGCPKGRGGEL